MRRPNSTCTAGKISRTFQLGYFVIDNLKNKLGIKKTFYLRTTSGSKSNVYSAKKQD